MIYYKSTQERYKNRDAGVVKLADTQDLGSCAERCAGSSPVTRIV